MHANNRVFVRRFVEKLRSVAPQVWSSWGDTIASMSKPRTMFADYDYMAIFEADLTIGPLAPGHCAWRAPKDLPGDSLAYDTPGHAMQPATLLTDLDVVDHPRYQWCSAAPNRGERNRFPSCLAVGAYGKNAAFAGRATRFASAPRKKSPTKSRSGCTRPHTIPLLRQRRERGPPSPLRTVLRDNPSPIACIPSARMRIHKGSTLEYFQHLRRRGSPTCASVLTGGRSGRCKCSARGITVPGPAESP